MKKYLLVINISMLLLFAGCSGKKEDNKDTKPPIQMGKKIDIFTFKDQFDKLRSVTEKTKKIIFVFTKETGHTTKEFLNQKPVDYLEKKDIIFVADVSPMPSLIREYFALPDLRKHQYPILLIYDEKVASKYKFEKEYKKIMIVDLDKLVIKDIKFLTTEEELKKEIDN